MNLKVHSIETFGTQDGPGIRMVVFLQGCNFRCLYCQNPDTQALKSKKAKEMSSEDLLDQLQKNRPYFKNGGGVTVSGGEPTLQATALTDFFTKCRAAGFHTALDTNGGVFSEEVKKLYEVTDLVIMDLKHIDPDRHQALTKAQLSPVLQNIEYREQTQQPFWLRYVLVPGWNDSEEILHRWGKTFADYQALEKVELLPYHTLGVHKFEEMGIDYPLTGVETPTKEQTEHAAQILKQYFKKVVIK